MKLAPYAFLLVLALAGCSTQATRSLDGASREEAYQSRAESLAAAMQWGLTARLGVDDGRDGGSGRLDWSTSQVGSTLDFRGALGRGAWRLEIEGGGATLTLADGRVASDASVQSLLERESGLLLPVEALHWWVRGLASPGHDHDKELDESGLLLRLEQDGWTVRYERYMEHAGLMLPRRLEASQGDYLVKLAISRWSLPVAGPGAKDA